MFQNDAHQLNAFQDGPGVLPTGWDIPPFQPPTQPQTRQRARALRGTSGFAFFNFVPYGWEIAPPQPPHRRIERAGAIMPSEQGYELPPPPFIPRGWDIQPFQPPHPPQPDGRAGGLMKGDEGIYAPFIRFFPYGWEIPPPLTRDYLFKNPDIGDQGIQFPFIRFFPYGWEIASPQPRHPRPEAAGAFMPSEAGIEAKLIVTTLPWGWEGQPPTLRYRNITDGWGLPDAGDQGIQFPFIRWVNAGWEIQPFQPPAYPTTAQRYVGTKGHNQFPIWSTWISYGWDIPSFQPPHPKPERAGAIATSEPGIENQFVSKPIVWGWDIPPFQPPAIKYSTKFAAFKVFGSIETPPFVFQPSGWEIPPPLTRDAVFKSPDIGDQGIQFPFIRWINFNWEVPPFQPPHPRPERSGAIATSEPGIEAKFVPTTIVWGWDIAAPFVRYRRFNDPDTGDQGTQASFINWINFNWEIPSFQPPHPRPEKTAAIMPWEAGIEAQYVFVPPFKWGWDVPAPHLRQQTSTRYFGIEGTSDFASFDFLPYGWELPPFQPPHPRPERGAPVITNEPGIEAVFIPAAFRTMAWEIAAPFVRYRRFNDPDIGDQGTQFPLIRFFPYGWEIPSPQPPHPRPERTGAIMPWESGIEAVFVPPAFVTDAWEVQAWQPPHPRPERWGALAKGDDGIQFPFIRWFNSGWEIAPFQPPHPRPEKAGAIMPWEAGIEAKYIFVAPPTIAWEIASFQPPHRAPEWKAAALFKGDEGIQFPLIRFFPYGWEIAPFQPSHPRAEKFGSVVRGDEGIQAQFIRWYNMGWEIPPYQPPHPRRERAGSIMFGHQGIDGIYVFVPPPTLATFDPNYLTYGQKRVQVTLLPNRLFGTYPPSRKTVTKPTD